MVMWPSPTQCDPFSPAKSLAFRVLHSLNGLPLALGRVRCYIEYLGPTSLWGGLNGGSGMRVQILNPTSTEACLRVSILFASHTTGSFITSHHPDALVRKLSTYAQRRGL